MVPISLPRGESPARSRTWCARGSGPPRERRYSDSTAPEPNRVESAAMDAPSPVLTLCSRRRPGLELSCKESFRFHDAITRRAIRRELGEARIVLPSSRLVADGRR